MTAIAEQLDKKLKTLDTKSASSLEKLVRDALELVESRENTDPSLPLSSEFLSGIRAVFGPEPFERPPQGISERREDW